MLNIKWQSKGEGSVLDVFGGLDNLLDERKNTIMDICNIVKNKKYTDEFVDLLNYCFGTNKDEINFEIEKLFEKDNSVILGAIDNNLLQGSLVINDFNIFWYGMNVKMGGIGAVSTFPEAREKHAVEKLLIEALKIMNDNNQVFSLLSPFSYAFYRKYGWEWGSTTKILEIDINDLSHFKSENYLVKPINRECIQQIKRVFEKCYSNYNGANKRTILRWEILFEKNRKNNIYSYGFYDNKDEIRGYIFYQLQDGAMIVTEMGYDSLSVKKQLLRFIYVHRAQVNKVKITVEEKDKVELLLNNQRQHITLNPGMMVRVINVKNILEMYPYKNNNDLEFSINIEDKYAPWNNSVFEVSNINNRVQVNEDISKQADISCTIQVFSQILFGFLSWKEAHELGIITCENKEVLEKLNDSMPEKSIFITDSF